MTANATSIQPSVRERRDYQRVQDAVGLQIELLSDEPAMGNTAAAPKRPQRVQVRKKNKYDIDGYGDVKRVYPAVSQYIDDLEERIRTLLLKGDTPAEAPTHKVSLSASGVAFAEDMVLQPGDIVGLRMTLFPALVRIGCDATVISVGDAQEVGSGDKHTYRAVFARITDHDRDAIDRHVESLRGRLPNDAE